MLKRLALFLILIPIGTTAAAAQSTGKTVLDGVFSVEQAKRGEIEYDARCGSCHGADLTGSGARALKGPGFLDRWREDKLESLFGYIKASMPRNSTVKLTDDAYLDVVTYILQKNEYPAGPQELKPEALRGIQVIGKDGPKPLPSVSMVQAVGCLTQGANNAWVVSSVTEPVRTRTGDAISGEDVTEAQARPMGTQTFRLGLTTLETFNPDEHKGHKMLVKGVVYRQANNDRISVTAIQMLADACAP